MSKTGGFFFLRVVFSSGDNGIGRASTCHLRLRGRLSTQSRVEERQGYRPLLSHNTGPAVGWGDTGIDLLRGR